MDEKDHHQEDTANIPHEQASHQELIPFGDDLLEAAMTPANTVYVSVPSICKALGIKNVQPQVLRICGTKVLRKGLRRIPIHTKGGFQTPYCLRIDLLALWLAGIEPSRMKIASERQRILQEKIEQYQEELAPEAMRIFLRVMGLNRTEEKSQEILAQETEIEQITGIATFMREHLEAMQEWQGHTAHRLEHAITLLEALVDQQSNTDTKLAKIDERTQRLTPAHTRDVQLQVERIARARILLYPNLTLEKARAITYGRLKTRFQAGSYKEISDDGYEDVLAYLQKELDALSAGTAQLPQQESLFE